MLFFQCIGAIRSERIAGQSSTGAADIDQVHKQAKEYSGTLAILNKFPPTHFTLESWTSALSPTRTQRRDSQMCSSSRVTPLPLKSACSPPVFPFFRNAGSPAPAFLRTLHPLLPPLHANSFELLDSELEKVDSFYSEREKEMRDRGRLLKEHLNELGQRRKKYYASLLFSNILRGHSRRWLIKSAARLGVSGLWGASEFLAQTFSLMPRGAVLYSAYDPTLQKARSTCGARVNWGSYFALATLPFLGLQVRDGYSVLLLLSITFGDATLSIHYVGVHGTSQWIGLSESANPALNIQYPLLRRGLVHTSQIPLHYVALTNYDSNTASCLVSLLSKTCLGPEPSSNSNVLANAPSVVGVLYKLLA
ncbi:uncharacterized protein HD556DRAFT_1311897 [Suillus plorans]|uniref:SPX domain-containing protein n=1 Tax=Suillus plorans TaxID=116603 RepID=A0A9P7DDN5_9AGAM|nr:uncharacterized protein HD556DRAFT_1311897 [Suillus plorans]KAG1788635.1 hypothetical protein HD556DRAFT_1311897 [Suillus plorans]